MASSERFPSKVDLWLAALPALGLVLPAAMLVTLGWQNGDWLALGSVLVVLVLATGLVVWLFADTWYTVTDDSLVVRCGPFRQTLALSSIIRVQPTHSVLSAPALSLDRLEVSYGGGSVLISPRDKDRFLARLRETAPAIHTPDLRGTRQSPRALPVLIAVLVFLHVLVGYIAFNMIRGARPPRVDETANTLTVGSRTIEMAAIRDISLQSELPNVVRRRNGISAGNTLRGSYTLEKMGNGDVYVDRRHPPFLLVRTDHDYLFVNASNPDATRALYDQVASAWHRLASPSAH